MVRNVGTDRTDVTFNISGAGLSGTPPIQFTRVADNLYIFLSGILSPTGNDQWVLVDGPTLAALTSMGGMTANSTTCTPNAPGTTGTTGAAANAGCLAAMMTTMNPLDGTAFLAGVNMSGMGTTQTLADETINGVATTHSRVTMAPSASMGSASPLAGTGVDIPNATVDVFTGKQDGLIRRIALTTQAVVDPNAVSGMLMGGPAAGATSATSASVSANIAFTMDFTDFNNKGIVIDAPANAVPLTDFTGPLPAGGIGGPGGRGRHGRAACLPDSGAAPLIASPRLQRSGLEMRSPARFVVCYSVPTTRSEMCRSLRSCVA